MRVILYSNEEFSKDWESGPLGASVTQVQDKKSLLKELDESEETCVVFFDFDYDGKKTEKLNKKISDNYSCHRFVYADSSSLKKLKNHQKGKHSADGYIVRPLTEEIMIDVLNDLKLADHIKENELVSEGEEVKDLPEFLKKEERPDDDVSSSFSIGSAPFDASEMRVPTEVRDMANFHNTTKSGENDESVDENNNTVSIQQNIDVESLSKEDNFSLNKLQTKEEGMSGSASRKIDDMAEELAIDSDLTGEIELGDDLDIGLELSGSSSDTSDDQSTDQENVGEGEELDGLDLDLGAGIDLSLSDGDDDLVEVDDTSDNDSLILEEDSGDDELVIESSTGDDDDLILENDSDDDLTLDDNSDDDGLTLDSDGEDDALVAAEGESVNGDLTVEGDGDDDGLTFKDNIDGEDGGENSKGGFTDPTMMMSVDDLRDSEAIENIESEEISLTFEDDEDDEEEEKTVISHQINLADDEEEETKVALIEDDGSFDKTKISFVEGDGSFDKTKISFVEDDGSFDKTKVSLAKSEEIEDDDLGFNDEEDIGDEEEDALTMVTEMGGESSLEEDVLAFENNDNHGLGGAVDNVVEQPIQITKGPQRITSSYNENELLRLQATIRQLREERDGNLDSIKELEVQKKVLTRENLGLVAERDEMKIEISIIKKRHRDEIDEMKYRLRISDEKRMISEEKAKNLQSEFGRLEQKVRVNFNHVKQHEKELENKLELMSIDSETQVKTRDAKIMELKRKIDQLEFNMENAIIKEQKSRDDKLKIEARMQKITRTLKGSIELIEDDFDLDIDFEQDVLRKMK